MTGYISTGHETKSFGSGGGAIRLVLTYIRGLLLVLVFYTLCGATALRPSNFKVVLVTPLFETAHSDLRFDLFKRFAIVHLLYKNHISDGSVICMTSSFGTKKSFK